MFYFNYEQVASGHRFIVEVDGMLSSANDGFIFARDCATCVV